MNIIKILYKYFKGYKLGLFLGPTLKLSEAVLELFIPIFMANIIDYGIPNNDINYIFQMAGLMLLFGVVGLIFALICQYYAAQVAYGFGNQLRNDLFSHILHLDNEKVYNLGANSLITRMVSDVQLVQNGVNLSIRLLVRAPYIMIGCIIMAFIINAKIAIIFLIATVLTCMSLYFIMYKTIPRYKKIQNSQDIITRKVNDNLMGVRVIRSFCKQKDEVLSFTKESESLSNLSINTGKISALLNPLTFAISNISIVGIVYFGAKFVENGELLNGDIIALVSYMTQTMVVLVVLAKLILALNKSIASAYRIVEVLNIKPNITQGKIEKAKKDYPNSIEFKNVNFSYNKESGTVLNNINFTVKKGESLGIIGGTGSGKSTIVNLLTRNYDVNSGEILIDGENVKNYAFKALKNKLGVVMQNSNLLKGSVLDNMHFAKEDASEKEIENALEIAMAKDFIMAKKDKLFTHISEGVKNLSGGQKQRLTIARAIVKNPEILILDDSFSALDYKTDANLRKALKEKCVDMCTVIISQRALTIKNCDNIIVLNDGDLVEQGTHEELLQNKAIYYEICVSQKLVEEAEINV